eukprot:maker-scaffold691_size110934-snap-gene-0.27 protein:Tk06093 transcript:maker-scaffold691_size110934-snap-gene-0.27-mRNA-1 annotation:"glycoside hydrolase family 3"
MSVLIPMRIHTKFSKPKIMEQESERVKLWNAAYFRSRHGLFQLLQVLLAILCVAFAMGAKLGDISIRSNVNELILLLALAMAYVILNLAFNVANLPNAVKFIRQRRVWFDKIFMERIPQIFGYTILGVLFTVSSHGNNSMGVSMIFAYCCGLAFIRGGSARKNQAASKGPRKLGQHREDEPSDGSEFGRVNSWPDDLNEEVEEEPNF